MAQDPSADIGPAIPESIKKSVEVTVTEEVVVESTDDGEKEPEAKRMKIVETETIEETFKVPIAAPKPTKSKFLVLQFYYTF